MPKITPLISSYFPVHAHSQYSTLDGTDTVPGMVKHVAGLGQPAMALTDHGTMAGVVRLYKECMKAGIAPFPGSEFYLVQDVTDDETKGDRMHLGLLALDEIGFRALIKLSSLSYDQFYKKPIIDWRNLAELSTVAKDHIAVTTGCRSGPVVSQLLKGNDQAASSMIWRLLRMFPNTFIEIQLHGITGTLTDDAITEWLVDKANTTGTYLVFGQDSHYTLPEHQPSHDLMKQICYFGDSDDYKFDGGPYDLADSRTIHSIIRKWEINRRNLRNAVEDGHERLLDLNKLKLPELDKYKFYVPQVGSSSIFKKYCKNGLAAKGLETDPDYVARINSEIKVIEMMGFGSYFMLFRRILGWARKQGIFFNVRGSANGSLVCYVLGITNIDPIKWDTDFNRFLSVDRKKPPDIDVDVESERRGELLAYIRTLFPTSVPIGTYARIGMSDDEADPRGSLIVQYMAAHRKKDPSFDGKVAKGDWPALEKLAAIPARKSAGVHAAGYVLPSSELPIDAYLATMWVGQGKAKTKATQATMEDVEDAGYVKGDFLGLQALTTFRKVIEALGKNPVTDGMDWIPDDDAEACKILRSGKTGTGVFQYEGYSTAKGGRELGVRSTFDAIVGLALYRPAMMDSGMTDRYVAARKAKQFQHLHPMIDPIMKDTWGVPVFQEQVISIMRTVGLNFEDLNDILKAVKASNDKIGEYAQATFNRVHPIFLSLAMSNLKCNRVKAEEIWATVMAFSDYGFNKAHATSYGLMSYRMAWLKAHHQLEFMAGLLSSWAGTPKEPMYVAEARRIGIQIGRPDINKSEVLWALDDRKVLRRGFLSIKGLGREAAETIVQVRSDGGPYASIDDLIARVPARPVSGGNNYKKTGIFNGVLARLHAVGGLTSLGARVD